MSNCEGCGKINVDIAFETKKQEAKKYAIETQKNYAIYFEAGEYCFIEAGEAIRGGYDIKDVVCFHS